MQVAPVADKVEHIMHGGYKQIYLIITDILLMNNMEDLVQLIIALFLENMEMKQKILIILDIAL